MNNNQEPNLEPDFNINQEDDEIIYVSKSEIKRDAEVLKKLGVELVNLSKNEISKIPLDEDLLYSIELAQKIKKEGYRRQIQYIGKLLRNRDIEPITHSARKELTANKPPKTARQIFQYLKELSETE